MKNYRARIGPAILAFVAAGYLLIPATMKAAETGDSTEVAKLLADARAEAAELKADATDMESFTKSDMNWRSYAFKIDMITDHINKSGKILKQLKDAEATGSPWQQTAIRRIEPLLRELADNTTATIKHLNDNSSKVHFPEFKDYVRANYELASDLEALIRDFVDYGNNKEKFERLSRKLEVG